MSESYRVLVVAEHEADASALEEILSGKLDVARVRTPAAALTALSEGSFHVICCDHELPEKDGVRFLQRALRVVDPPCFLWITSATEMRDKQLEGLSGVILKPYDGQALVDRVLRLCQITETRRRVASARESMRRSVGDPGSS